VKRRTFITLLGGAAAWPLAARAQQDELRHIAVFLGLAENNPATISGVQHLRDALAELGWTDGKNVRFTYRYADGNPTRARALAKQIVEAQTDLIVAHTTPVVAALQNATRSDGIYQF
jgi:putative ABC transport system substrate-binding protein